MANESFEDVVNASPVSKSSSLHRILLDDDEAIVFDPERLKLFLAKR